MTTWTVADFAEGKTGQQFVELAERLTIHGFPLGMDDTLQEVLQRWQLAQGFKGTQKGGGADGYMGPVSLRRLWAAPASPPPPPPPPPPTYPAQVLNLGNWKLTLPIGQVEKPTEIKQPALATFRDPRYFYVAPSGGVVMRAHCGGVTTSGSDYPRTELRELRPGGDWQSSSGTHSLRVRGAVTELPIAKPDLVVAQIHDGSDDIVEVRLEGKRLFVEADGDEVGVLDLNYLASSRFEVKITASADGIVVAYRNEATGLIRVVEHDQVGLGWYFKAGAYVQSNPSKGDTADAAGEVVIYELEVLHAA